MDICREDGDTYPAFANLTFDSYDTSALQWFINTLDGDPLVDIDANGDVLLFGSGGGKYEILVKSSENTGCNDRMILNVIKYDIQTYPDPPWAGDVVTYSLTPDSFIPFHITPQWTAPNDFMECGSSATQPPTFLGGQFRVPNHLSGDHSVTVSASCGTKQKTVTAQCKDCTGLVIAFNEAFANHDPVRQQAEQNINDLTWLAMAQYQYRDLGIRLGAFLAIYAYQNIPPNPWAPHPTAGVQTFLSNLSNQAFKPAKKESAIQLAEQMDYWAAIIKPLQEQYASLYCEYRATYDPYKQAHVDATGCIMSVEARKLCESIFSELPPGTTIQGKAGYPCEVVDPEIHLLVDRWTVYEVLTFFGVANYQLSECN